MPIRFPSGIGRRDFLKLAGATPAVAPLLTNLPALAGEGRSVQKKQRLIIVFSPNGVVPEEFWPEPTEGTPEQPLKLTPILEPLAPFADRTLTIRGLCDLVRGDGDNHMRGMGCLLTGIELFPGNLQGGAHTPAGWSSGKSIDQELRAALQTRPETQTRFGSLELGVLVPERADTWTRMVYAGPNQPIAPIDNPYELFAKLYGDLSGKKKLASVLDGVREDLAKVRELVGEEDRQLLDRHAAYVRDMEQQIEADRKAEASSHALPQIDEGVREENDNMPKLSRMQTELLVGALQADFTRVATYQFTNSVGSARMRWLGIEEGHHELSHRPDSDTDAVDKLTRINRWYAEEIAHLAQRLADTPEPGGDGTLLDNTLIFWTNELGKGNSHTLDDVPCVLVGGGLGLRGGRAIALEKKTPHNRLLLWLANAMGHPIERFGKHEFCDDGPLTGLA